MTDQLETAQHPEGLQRVVIEPLTRVEGHGRREAGPERPRHPRGRAPVVDQPHPLGQHVEGPDTTAGDGSGAVGHLVADVLGTEHRRGLVRPVLRLEPFCQLAKGHSGKSRTTPNVHDIKRGGFQILDPQ